MRESLTNVEVNQALDHYMGKELNFLRGDSQAATIALAKIVSNMLETEEDQEDTHVGLYFLNGECTGIRLTHLDLSLEPDTIKSDVCILLGLDKHNISDSESIEPTIELCDTLKTKGRTGHATNCSQSPTPETGAQTTPTIATPERRETGLLDTEDAKELLKELVKANKEIQRLNNYSASKRELWKNAMTRSTGLSPSTTQELVAQMSKKQLTIEIHRLGADYPVKTDQKASKKAAIKLLRKLLKEEHESQEPLERRSKGMEETEITRLTAENKRLNLYVETMNRERRPSKVTYAIDLGTQTTGLGQEETSKHAEADEGSPKEALDKGSHTEDEDTLSQQKVAAVNITNTVAQDLKEREMNKVPTLEFDEAQEEERQQKYTLSHPYAAHQQGRGTPADPIEALQQQYYFLHRRLQRIEDMHVGLESTEHMPPAQEEEKTPHTPPTADQSTSPMHGIPVIQQEEPEPQYSNNAHMSTPTRPRIRASSLVDADHNILIPPISQDIELPIQTSRKTQIEMDRKQGPAKKGTTTEPAAQPKQKHSVRTKPGNKIPRHDAKVALMISDNASSFRHEEFSSKVTTKPIKIDSVTDLKTEKTRRQILKEPKVDFIILDIPCDAGTPDQIAAYAAAIEDFTAYFEDRSTATILVLIPITETLAEQNSLCNSITTVAKGHRTAKLKILNNATLYDKSTGLPKERFQGDLKRLKGTCFNQLKRWFHSIIDPVKAPLSADKTPAARRRRFPSFMVFSNPQHAKNDLPKAQAQAPNNGPTNSGTQKY